MEPNNLLDLVVFPFVHVQSWPPKVKLLLGPCASEVGPLESRGLPHKDTHLANGMRFLLFAKVQHSAIRFVFEGGGLP